MSKIAVVTGASSGLGREFVVQISEKYKTIDEIWVIARRAERLYALEREIEGTQIIVLPLDITKQEDLEAYKKMLAKEHPWVRVLVNAAGYGIMGHVEDVVCEELTGMIDVNCKALVAMTKITLPYMKEQSNIINIASSAAYLPQPSFAVYAATKSMVRSFSKALNKELEDRGITVTAVCPGPVNTEFFDVAEKYSHTKAFKRLFRVEAKNVVKRALFDAYYLKTESTYSITMKAFKIVTKLLPNDWIVSMIKQRQISGKYRDLPGYEEHYNKNRTGQKQWKKDSMDI